jgi:hypothetical protein
MKTPKREKQSFSQNCSRQKSEVSNVAVPKMTSSSGRADLELQYIIHLYDNINSSAIFVQ